MLELAVLGLLKEQPMHGYELKKELSQKLGHFWQVSFGSLYPTLNRLEKRNAVEKIYSDEDTSRRKNVYRITEIGEKEFLELILDRPHTAWEEDKFPLRMAFFRYLKPETRIRLLERRKAYLQEKLDDLQSSMRQARERIDGYTLSLLKHNLDGTANDIAWLDELIAAERRQPEPGGGDDPVPASPDPSPRPRGGRGAARSSKAELGHTRTTTGERAPVRSRP